MSTEFFWRLPLGTDGQQLSTDLHNRGSFNHSPGHIAPGRRANGEPDGFTYIDYIAQVAKAAELAGFEGALLPTGPEPWIVAAALARETRRIRFLVAFQATWTLPAYAAQQAAILQHLSEHLNMAGNAGYGYPANDPRAINEPGRTLWTKVDVSF